MITVIIPVYNVEKYIKQCLDTVVGQTYTDLEIILVDDGSTDKSGYICDEYASIDNRIKVIHKQNGGLSSARNVALDIAKGEFIAFVDSDDYLNLCAFEKCIKKLHETKADICMFSHFITNGIEHREHKLVLEREFYNQVEVRNIIYPKLFGSTETDSELEGFVCRQIFRREIIGTLRFRSEREYFAEDVVFDIELYPHISSLCIVKEPLYYYRYEPNSLSNSYRKDLFKKLQKLLVFMDEKSKEHCVEDVKQRILRCAYRFALYGCRNLKRGCELTKKQKMNGILEIVRDPYVVESLNVIPKNTIKDRIFIWLVRRKAARLILALT